MDECALKVGITIEFQLKLRVCLSEADEIDNLLNRLEDMPALILGCEMPHLEEALVKQVIDEKQHKLTREENQLSSLFHLWVIRVSYQPLGEVDVGLYRTDHLVMDRCAQGRKQTTLLFHFLEAIEMSDICEVEKLTLFVVEAH